MADTKIRRAAQRVHFRRRVTERLGYPLANSEISKIKQDIRDNTLHELASSVPRLRIYQILVDNRPCVVLYDIHTEELVTFLTLGMWQERKLAKSPADKSTQSLRGTLEDTPAGEVLKKLKENK